MGINPYGKSGSGSTCTIRIGRSYRLSGDAWRWFYSEFHLLGGLTTTIRSGYLELILELCISSQFSTIIRKDWSCYISCR